MNTDKAFVSKAFHTLFEEYSGTYNLIEVRFIGPYILVFLENDEAPMEVVRFERVGLNDVRPLDVDTISMQKRKEIALVFDQFDSHHNAYLFLNLKNTNEVLRLLPKRKTQYRLVDSNGETVKEATLTAKQVKNLPNMILYSGRYFNYAYAQPWAHVYEEVASKHIWTVE